MTLYKNTIKMTWYTISINLTPCLLVASEMFGPKAKAFSIHEFQSCAAAIMLRYAVNWLHPAILIDLGRISDEPPRTDCSDSLLEQ